MRDIEEELSVMNKDRENFINEADHGVSKPKKKHKYDMTTLSYNKKQYKLFDTVKKEVASISGVESITIRNFLHVIWNYHTRTNKCNPKDYINYSLFLSQRSSKVKDDSVVFVISWDLSTQAIKDYVLTIEDSMGKIKLKGTILLLVLHYAKTELGMDLSEYL